MDDFEKYKLEIKERDARSDTIRQKFFKKYKKLFKPITSDPNNKYNFDLPQGWVELVDELCQKVNQFKGVEVVQVKQKFGGLRFYLERESIVKLSDTQKADLYALIHEAEETSFSVCETCGATNAITKTEGFVQSLCPTCKNENR